MLFSISSVIAATLACIHLPLGETSLVPLQTSTVSQAHMLYARGTSQRRSHHRGDRKYRCRSGKGHDSSSSDTSDSDSFTWPSDASSIKSSSSSNGSTTEDSLLKSDSSSSSSSSTSGTVSYSSSSSESLDRDRRLRTRNRKNTGKSTFYSSSSSRRRKNSSSSSSSSGSSYSSKSSSTSSSTTDSSDSGSHSYRSKSSIGKWAHHTVRHTTQKNPKPYSVNGLLKSVLKNFDSKGQKKSTGTTNRKSVVTNSKPQFTKRVRFDPNPRTIRSTTKPLRTSNSGCKRKCPYSNF